MVSLSKNLTAGKKMDKGIPGKPPPVPMSTTSAPGSKLQRAAMANECKTCFS